MSLLDYAVPVISHEDHQVHPHEHPAGKVCSGRFYCLDCREFFDGEKCYAGGKGK
jgi:hypothetical protein